MYSKYFILFFLITIQLMIQLKAQDSTYFFPHHLGDTWEYFHDGFEFDTLQTKIVFDSTDVAGNHYVGKEHYFINPFDPQGTRYYKIDTLGNVYETNGHFNFPRWIYKPDAIKGEFWIIEDFGGGYDIAQLKNVYTDTLFNISTIVKEIWFYGTSDTSDTTVWLHQATWRFSDRFGLMFLGGGDIPFDRYLKGVIIDSITYGNITSVLVSIEGENFPVLPNQIHLYQNFPNPFNPQTTIPFSLEKSAIVSLTIYNIIGKEVMRLLVNEHFLPGLHKVAWSGKTQNGQLAASGIYFYRLQAGKTVISQQMLLVR